LNLYGGGCRAKPVQVIFCMKTHLIKGTRNYFISSNGYVFKVEKGKEIRCKARLTPKSKEVRVFVNGKDCNLLYLMIEYFFGEIKPTDSIKFKINKNLEISYNSIRIRSAIGNDKLSAHEEKLLFDFNCHIKATSANARAMDKITGIEVFKVLQISDFRCVYCGCQLHPKTFHLDHFQSLHKGGKNRFRNLVASCNICNLMKGAMDGNEFYAMCKKIVSKYLYANNLPIESQ